MAFKLPTRDEVRRIAVNIAKLNYSIFHWCRAPKHGLSQRPSLIRVADFTHKQQKRAMAFRLHHDLDGGGAVDACSLSITNQFSENMRPLIFQIFSLGFLLLFSFAFIDRIAAETSLKKATVAYREIDDHKILADVYRSQDAKIRPVIVWIHGGALIMGNRELETLGGVTRFLLAFAKTKGCAVVSIDYRLAPETKLPDIISDIEEAFRWLAGSGAKQFHLDPRRIVVAGESAGGYLTLVTGYRVRPKPKALVALYGFGDLIGDWSSKPNPYPRYNLRKISRDEAESQTDGTVISDSNERKGDGGLIYMYYRQNGLWPEEVSGFARSTIADKITPFEPIRNVTPDWPPTLLIHGTRDTDVPYEQSELMAKKFKQKRVPFSFIPIDHGEHFLEGGDPQKIREASKAMGEFIKEHLNSE